RPTARPRSAPVPIPSRKLPRLACELTSSTTSRLCSRRRHGQTVLTGKVRLLSSRLKRTIPGRCRGSSNTSSRQPSSSPTLISRLLILADGSTTSQEGPAKRKRKLSKKEAERRDPKNLPAEDIVRLVNAMKSYEDFVSPDPTSLSPLGADLLATGIKKELGISDEDVQNGSAYVATLQ